MSQPYVHIELDKPRKLRFRHNDIADLEVFAGKSLGQMMSAVGLSFNDVRILLAFALRWMDDKMTPAKAGVLAQTWYDNGGSLDSLVEKLIDTLRAGGFVKTEAVSDEPGDAEGNANPEMTTA